jgi:predicted anti-sigma-YlaC factor YlaD
MSSNCTEIRTILGVYVLGAIEPAERALVDAHLGGCRDCRDELAGLAGLPSLLGRVTEAQIAEIGAAPIGLLDSMLSRAAGENRSRRRRGRVWLAVAAAAAIAMAGGGVLGGMHIGESSRPAARATAAPAAVAGRTLNRTDPVTGVSALVTMQSRAWGTSFRVQITDAPFGAKCRLIAIDRNGKKDIAGTWQVTYGGNVEFSGASMIPSDQIGALEVRTLSGERLVTIPA